MPRYILPWLPLFLFACSSPVSPDMTSEDLGRADDSGEMPRDASSDVPQDVPLDGSQDATEDAPVDAPQDSGGDLEEDMAEEMTPACEGDCTRPLPGCDLEDVQRAPGNNWSDSYSVDGKCYCDTTFDHNIGDIMVETPAGPKTVREVCEALGPGPGVGDNPVYNDVQCGNGPANDAGDEDWCPGRVDQGEAGCCTAGPTWDLEGISW